MRSQENKKQNVEKKGASEGLKEQNRQQRQSYLSLLYPILAGMFGFAATAIGAHFFNRSHPYYYIGIGIALFLLANHMLYKLKFNSYHNNGATVTTVLVFTAQVISAALYRMQQIEIKWVVGLAFILFGTVLIENKPKQTQQHKLTENMLEQYKTQ